MNRKHTLIALIVIAVLGSLFTALGSNLFFSDILNIAGAAENNGVIVTIPACTFAVLFVIAFLFVSRWYQRPKTFKRLARLYLIIAAVISLVGVVTSLLTGISFYGTMFGLYPFPGYAFIFMLLHLAVLGGSCFGFVKVMKLPEDEEKYKVGVLHCLRTFGWFLFICLAFNRLGMFLGVPLYLHLRTLYFTFPFYLFLLVPAYLGTLKMLNILGYLPKKKLAVILAASAAGLNLVLFGVIALIGSMNSTFIAAISPAMPLDRLASKPLEL